MNGLTAGASGKDAAENSPIRPLQNPALLRIFAQKSPAAAAAGRKHKQEIFIPPRLPLRRPGLLPGKRFFPAGKRLSGSACGGIPPS
jgi:hypothetical protein